MTPKLREFNVIQHSWGLLIEPKGYLPNRYYPDRQYIQVQDDRRYAHMQRIEVVKSGRVVRDLGLVPVQSAPKVITLLMRKHLK